MNCDYYFYAHYCVANREYLETLNGVVQLAGMKPLDILETYGWDQDSFIIFDETDDVFFIINLIKLANLGTVEYQ